MAEPKYVINLASEVIWVLLSCNLYLEGHESLNTCITSQEMKLLQRWQPCEGKRENNILRPI